MGTVPISRQADDEIHSLAVRVRQLGIWLDAQEGLVSESRQFSAPPFGNAYLTKDPHSSSPAASLNCNRICLNGAGDGLTQTGLQDLLASFAARGIKRVFVWLSPGPEIERVREWLSTPAFRRVQWTRYPTLRWLGSTEPTKSHGLEIRAVGVAAFATAKAALGEVVFEGFERTLEKPGFHHFIAYDGARPIAAAALVKFEEIGYLTYAATAKADRGRGAQSALIAHRVAVARELGCTTIISQTLTMLAHSFANLRRAGFREIYEQEVFEFIAP
jgi:N-acetylglutamate synthase-like GNAT family acetyltransferase